MIDLASRFYKAGEVIVTCERPLVQSTKYEHRPFTCDHCMAKLDSSLACPKCRKVYYCGADCLEKHRDTIHKYECDIFSRRAPMKFETNGFDYMQRLSLRLYLLLKHNPEMLKQEFVLHNGLKRTILNMESHSKEILTTEQFKGIVNYFIFYEIKDYDAELLLRVYGILQCNAFGIDCYDGGTDNDRDVLIESRGSGLYPEVSVFDHDCVPNACASGDGLKLEIRALTSIDKGQKITIDYLQDVLSRNERQTILRQRYFFTCQCPKGCKDGLKDASFDSKVDYKKLTVLNNIIRSLMENFIEPVQESATSNIHDQNCLTKFFRKDTKFNDWKRLAECWKKRLELQEAFYTASVHHPCLSLFYREFLLLNLYLVGQPNPGANTSGLFGDRSTMQKDIVLYSERAREHLTITHGVEHIFYTKLFSRSQPTLG